jgi:hypothetical protein
VDSTDVFDFSNFFSRKVNTRGLLVIYLQGSLTPKPQNSTGSHRVEREKGQNDCGK